MAAVVLLSLAAAACSDSDPTAKEEGAAEQPVTYSADKMGCSLFTPEDAASILGVPAAEIRVAFDEHDEGNWHCGFSGGGLDKLVSFYITLSGSSEEAAREMAQYRSHLETIKGTKPFQDELADGPYTEVAGVGDEALWTRVNRTLSVRKGNVSIQVITPKGESVQVEVAKTFLSHL